MYALRNSKRLRVILPMLLLVLTVVLWQHFESVVVERETNRFEGHAESIIREIQERLDAHVMILRGGAGLLAASEEVTREEWNAYFQVWQSGDVFPGIRGMTFAPVVTDDKLEEHIASLHDEGFADYAVWPDSTMDVRVPVVFAEPWNEINRSYLGYDLLTNEAISYALDEAKLTGAPALLSRVSVPGLDDDPALVLILPAFEKILGDHGVDAQRGELLGYVVGIYVTSELMCDVCDFQVHPLDFKIYDGLEAAASRLIFSGHVPAEQMAGSQAPTISRQYQMVVFGQTWSLVFESTPAFEAALDRYSPKVILAAGLLIAFVFALYLRALELTMERATSIANEMTMAVRAGEEKYRFLTESINDVIWTADLSGQLTYISPAVEAMLGYTPEEILSMSQWTFMPEQDRRDLLHRLQIEMALPAGQRSSGLVVESRQIAKDGSRVDVELSASWIEDPEGNPTGIQGSTRDVSKRKKVEAELLQAYDATIEGWAYALDLKDEETESHSKRVTELTLRIAERMGIEGEDLVHMRRGALLHDIGKMGISDRIIRKAGPLTEDEWAIMRRHPVHAFQMLARVDYLWPALDIPYCHHERWDGSGYPRGLKGKEIPLAARIFAVADVYDALTSDRPYRIAWSASETLDYIVRMSGQLFDPEVVEIFAQIVAS